MTVVFLSSTTITLCFQLSLGGDHPKSKEEIFSIIKIAAAEQSDPQQAVLLITNEIERVVKTRPTTWVVDNMNVLMTEGK